MTMEEKLINIILAIMEKKIAKQKKDEIFTKLLRPLNMKASTEYLLQATPKYYLLHR